MRCALLAIAIVVHPAHADVLAVGAELGAPGQGSGMPVGGLHIPFGLLARYAHEHWPTLAGGIGVPIAGVGASAWAGVELRIALAPHLALLAEPGLRSGFAGPGYYARESHVFVGYAYNYSGPWTIAPRLPVGLAIQAGRAELFVEVLAELPLLPSPQLLVGGATGVRITL